MPGLIRAQSNIILGGGGDPLNGLYLRGLETPRADTVLMDDFSNGFWYLVDSDHTDYHNVPPGWGATIFANPITPAGAVRNLLALGKKPLFTRSNWAATTGFIQGVDGGVLPARNHAWHNLFGGGSGGYNELYIRWYTRFLEANYLGAGNPVANYTWGQQKGGTINKYNADGGIDWAGMGYNTGFGRPDPNTTSAELTVTNNHGPNNIIHQNLGNTVLFVPGRWYFIEAHIKLNSIGSINGVWELWINDGGSTGDFSGQTPIKRANHTNIDWGRTALDTQLMGVWWPENWSNPASVGEQLWANIHIATNSPLGFAS